MPSISITTESPSKGRALERAEADRAARNAISCGDSLRVPSAFLAIPSLTPTEVLTLAMVWRSTAKGELAELPARVVAKTLGVTMHAAQSSLDGLVAAGYLLRRGRGQGSPASYLVDSCRVLAAANERETHAA